MKNEDTNYPLNIGLIQISEVKTITIKVKIDFVVESMINHRKEKRHRRFFHFGQENGRIRGGMTRCDAFELASDQDAKMMLQQGN